MRYNVYLAALTAPLRRRTLRSSRTNGRWIDGRTTDSFFREEGGVRRLLKYTCVFAATDVDSDTFFAYIHTTTTARPGWLFVSLFSCFSVSILVSRRAENAGVLTEFDSLHVTAVMAEFLRWRLTWYLEKLLPRDETRIVHKSEKV